MRGAKIQPCPLIRNLRHWWRGMPPRSLNSPDGEQQEEYSTLLVWLHNQVQTGEPSEAILGDCLLYFEQFASIAA